MQVKIIGLTGGIGSGKTYVANIFAMMGIPVYDSDSNAKRLMTDDPTVVKAIKDLLTAAAYNETGLLNRAYISKIVFGNPLLLKALNAIVHPAVRKDFQKYVEAHKNSELIINEAALFVENGTYKDFDFLISVVAPKRLRIARVISRDGRDKKEVKARINAQSSDQEKIAVSDFVIYNDATQNLFAQIPQIHKELITFARK